MWMRKPNRMHVLPEHEFHRLASGRQFIWMVMLLAIKDCATEIRFHPNRDHNLELFVRGIFVDLIPIPRNSLNDIRAELRRMIEICYHQRVLFQVRSFFGIRKLSSATGRTLKGRFRLQIKEKQVQVLVRIASVDSGGRITLRLVNPIPASLKAGYQLKTLVSSKEAQAACLTPPRPP